MTGFHLNGDAWVVVVFLALVAVLLAVRLAKSRRQP